MFDAIALAQECAASVHPNTVVNIMRVESQFNPYAIGVVGAHLKRQPKSLPEALATANWLEANGYNYSVGLMQVNRANFSRMGLTLNSAFESCKNVQAGANILTDCFQRAQQQPNRADVPQVTLRDAFSCYYAGNFKTGYTAGYVLKVVTGQGSVALDRVQQRRWPNTKNNKDPNAGNPSVTNTNTAMLF